MKTVTLSTDDIHKGSLILINKGYPLVRGKNDLALVPVNSEYPEIHLEATTAAVLTHLLEVLQSKGKIVPVSGYRSLEQQQSIYADSIDKNGGDFTNKYVALPNHSEHQTGLAIDMALAKDEIDFTCPEFPYEGICNAFREKALSYGFIERYQRGKEIITGIAHESWHFRYVGYPHSYIMKEKNFVLEEYIEFMKWFPYEGEHFITKIKNQEVEIFYVNTSHRSIQLPENSIYQISGNNVDGFIITLWR